MVLDASLLSAQHKRIGLASLSSQNLLKNEMDSIRDETIRSSHDTIRIDTKEDDMVIFDSIRYNTDNNCKNTNIHNVHIYTNIHNVNILLFMNTTEECFD